MALFSAKVPQVLRSQREEELKKKAKKHLGIRYTEEEEEEEEEEESIIQQW